MNKTILLSILLIGVSAAAQKKSPVYSTPPTTSYSYSPTEFSNSAGGMNASGILGWFGTSSAAIYKDSTTQGTSVPLSGLLAIGGDFEYLISNDLGAGAILKYYSTSDTTSESASVTTESSLSALAIGGYARFHFPHRQLDFYVSPGLGVTSSTFKTVTGSTTRTIETGLVFTFFTQYGVMYALNRNMAAGFETSQYLPWSTEVNGWLLQDFALKFRYNL